VQQVTINQRWMLTLPDHRARGDWWDHWEEERLASMAEHLNEFDLIAYIGAEQGDMPALCASWGCATVLVEPVGKVWPGIRATFEANGLPLPWATFAGFAGATDHFAHEHLVERWWPPEAEGPVSDVEGFANLCERPDLPVITLNTIRSVVGPLSAISIDVEGSELEVLRGAAAAVLTKDRPKVWVSIHPDFMHDMYDQEPWEVHSLMESHGYVGTLLADVHEQHWYFEPK